MRFSDVVEAAAAAAAGVFFSIMKLFRLRIL
jgi:hypothetical protein